MAFQLSPGVNVSEIDLTTIVPGVGTTEGAFAGDFVWGPVNTIVTVSNEIELVDRFGRPDSNTFASFFTAANFLGYGRNLKVVRAGNTAVLRNATSGPQTLLIANQDDYNINHSDLPSQPQYGLFAARYAGSLGDSLKVSMFSNSGNTIAFNNWAYSAEFDGVPDTSNYVAGVGGSKDEMHIIVIDEDGKFTGTANTVLEKFAYLSKASDAKNDDGSSNYYVNVINDRSKYIYIMNHSTNTMANVQSITFTSSANGYSNGNIIFSGGTGANVAGYINVNATNFIVSATITNRGSGYDINDVVTGNISHLYVGGANAVGTPANTATATLQFVNYDTNWGTPGSGKTFTTGNTGVATSSLSNGVYAVADNAALTNAYDKFANPEEVDVSLIMAGPHPQTVAEHIVDNIAEVRKDCIAFISPERADVVNNDGDEVTDIISYRNLFNSSSYAVMDSNWKYQFDKYNNVYRWVPLNGDIAGLCVRTDNERDPWFSPAGFNRGQIKNVVKLAWNPTKAERDDLYKAGVNPVVSFPGEGVVLYGDKTLLARPSAFDRINVRRLFIVLEKAIARASRYSLFEFNDEFTRAQFVALVEPFLRDVQGRRGIFDFRVVCDDTNNTPEVIDRNEFVGDIYIKPARSINFIQLNFVAVRTGVAFDEIVGRF